MKRFLIYSFLIAIIASCTKIEAGYEGILIKQYGTDKGVDEVSLVSGKVTYNPWSEDVEQFPVFVITKDYEPFELNSKDGSEFTVDPTISIRVVKGNSPRIYTKYRMEMDDIVETTILNYVMNAYRIQFNKYTVDEITSKREDVELAIEKSLQESLGAEGFNLEQMTSGIKYPESIITSINAKNQAVQLGLQKDNEVKTAEAEAKIKIAKTRGEADALVIQAEAEYKANKLRQTSLTQLLVDQQAIEKWDGKLPVYGITPQLFKSIGQ